MVDKDTAPVAETYRLMIADNVKEITDTKSLKGILSYTELILNFHRKQVAHERKG